jgi:hypothetical protein
MNDVPPLLRIWSVLAVALAFASVGVAATGWVPSGGVSETLPVTVRDNPASWRPSYVGWSGWRSPSSTGGGGFGFGK